MVVHSQAVKSLSPSDYLMIENEHARLKRFLSDLHDTCVNLDNMLDCPNCTTEKFASCRGQLPSYFYDLMDLSRKHFHNEETIMLSRPHVSEEYGYFRNHREAHSDILLALNDIVNACVLLNKQGKTAEGYRMLYKKISALFEDHDHSFDDPFLQSTVA